MLSSTLPFDNENKEIMFKKIVTVDLDFNTAIWEHTSKEAKDFIKILLERDPEC